ncbi:MAG: T9SS type A sorting domain-containing protein [Bacteroidetes bacterium]|nr:T9SS type A sorting domain-containing protein [Bacteroidota bacterium]
MKKFDPTQGVSKVFLLALFVTLAGIAPSGLRAQIYTENFDGAWTSPAPTYTTTWTSNRGAANANAWHRNDYTTNWTYPTGGSPSATGAGSSTYYARFHSYGINSGTSANLTSASINLSAYSSCTLTFYYINPSGSDGLTVTFSNNGGSSFGNSNSYTTSGSWAQQSITIPAAYLVSNFQIKFAATSDYGNDDIGIDQVAITGTLSCTPPAITTQPSTATQSLCVGGSSTALTVATSAGSPTYQWYSNTTASNSGGTSISGATSASYSPPTTSAGTTYYYCQVTASSCTATSNVSGAVTVTALPSALATAPSPSNAATGVCYAGTGAISSLSWTAAVGATSYDVYFGAGSLPGSATSNVSTTSYTPASLSPSTTYYWKVVPRNSCGVTTASPVTWTFTTAAAPCYCTPAAGTSSTTYINNFTTTGAQTNINNSSGYSTGGYGNYSASAIAQQVPGGTVNFSIGISGVGSGVGVGVWVDWNQNGDFTDAGDYVASTTAYTTATTLTGSFTVPAGATTGTTRIRIIVNYNAATPTSCVAASSNRGEAEDYGLFICPPVTITAHPSTSPQSICKGGSLTALSVTATNATTYQWYQNSIASNSGGTAVTTGTGGTTSSYTPSTTTGSSAYYYCVASSNCASATSGVSGLITVSAPYTPSDISGSTTICVGGTTTLSSAGPAGGTASVTGTYPNSYIVQTFTSSSNLVVPAGMTDLVADALVVAGGGGGGSNGGGGGGGGGVKYVSGLSLPAGTTAVTVGTGGAAAASSSTTGSNGGNSSIGSLATAIGGGGGASRDGGPGGQNGGSGGGGAGAGTGSGTCSPGTFSGTRSDGGYYDVGASGSVTINCMPAGATITNVHMDVSIGSGCSSGWYSLAYSYDDYDYYYYPGAECGGTFDETLWNGDGNGAVIYVAPYDEDGWTDNASISINSGTTVSYTYPLTTNTAGTGTTGQGSNGANGTAGDAGCNAAGGGGGGAGGAGSAASNNAAGNGGAGISYDISGTATYYGGGGGGGTTNYTGCGGGSSWTNGTGGVGGGSNGESGTPGTSGLGGGGGAETAGGSGVVILRYPGGKWTSGNTAVATVDPVTGVVTGVSAGTATITYTVATGTCTNAVSTTVTVNSPSTAVTSITGAGTVCQGSGVTLTATGGSLGSGANYQWGTGTTVGSNPIPGATSATYSVTPASTTSYWVSVTGPSPCNGAGGTYTTVNIATPSSAVTGISGITTLCSGNGTTLTATGGSLGTGANYQWGTGSVIGTNPIPGATSFTYSVTPSFTTSYWVSVTGPSPCNGAGGVYTTVSVSSASANAALATSSVNGVTLSEQCTDNNGWTYYADPSAPASWLFGVYKNGNTFTPSVTLTVNSNVTETRNDALKKASYTLDRYWNISISGSISSAQPVKVRFFYSASDTAAMRAAAVSRAAAYGLPASAINGLEWFKTTAGIAFDPGNNTYSDVPNKMLPSVVYGSLNSVSYIEYQGLTSFSGGTAGMRLSPNGVALPVQLMYLTATPVDNSYLRLDWATASEINNRGFEVQRSTDGINYEVIGWVDGHVNSNTKLEYSYDDRSVVPNSIYYYRLRQVDLDGKDDYSNIVSGTIIGRGGFVVESLRPNPASDKVTVQVVSSAGQSATVTLTDALGRELEARDWEIYEGFNGINLDLSPYAAGTYNIVIRSQNQYFTLKLVINR